MKAKWLIGTLTILFAVLGICHNQISIPNQEISVQFNTDEVTTEQSQNAIASIMQQLQTLGVGNMQVREEANGILKITYHSAVDVESIKKTLSKEDLNFAYTSFEQHKQSDKSPKKDNKRSYNLDIYEIHKATDSNSDSTGKYVLNIKQDYDRFSNSNVFLASNEIDYSDTDRLVKQAYKVNRTITIALDNLSKKIPEVRAGPLMPRTFKEA